MTLQYVLQGVSTLQQPPQGILTVQHKLKKKICAAGCFDITTAPSGYFDSAA